MSHTERNARRYVGWMVLRSDLVTGQDRKFARVGSQAEGQEMVRRMNAESPPTVLFWAEWWGTSSSLEQTPLEAECVEVAEAS
jgi:hypothetical protein